MPRCQAVPRYWSRATLELASDVRPYDSTHVARILMSDWEGIVNRPGVDLKSSDLDPERATQERATPSALASTTALRDPSQDTRLLDLFPC